MGPRAVRGCPSSLGRSALRASSSWVYPSLSRGSQAGPRLRNAPVMPRRLMSIDLVVARLRRGEVQQLPFSVATLRAYTSPSAKRQRKRATETETPRVSRALCVRTYIRAPVQRASASFMTFTRPAFSAFSSSHGSSLDSAPCLSFTLSLTPDQGYAHIPRTHLFFVWGTVQVFPRTRDPGCPGVSRSSEIVSLVFV